MVMGDDMPLIFGIEKVLGVGFNIYEVICIILNGMISLVVNRSQDIPIFRIWNHTK